MIDFVVVNRHTRPEDVLRIGGQTVSKYYSGLAANCRTFYDASLTLGVTGATKDYNFFSVAPDAFSRVSVDFSRGSAGSQQAAAWGGYMIYYAVRDVSGSTFDCSSFVVSGLY